MDPREPWRRHKIELWERLLDQLNHPEDAAARLLARARCAAK